MDPTDVTTGARTSGFRGFVILWLGQFASMIGSNLTGFALAVHVYRESGSATNLGLVLALGLLPAIVATPFTGSLVDRWGTSRSLLVSNAGALLVTLTVGVLVAADGLAIWHVYVVVTVLSVLSALELPAFAALVPQLVPRQHLGRANGMRMIAMAVSQVLAPVTAGFLLLAISLFGIVLVDIASFGLAIFTIWLVRIPHRRPPAATKGGTGLLAEFREGWAFIAARPGLVALLLFLGAMNFGTGFVELLINPLVLSFASSASLGVVLSLGGLGMVITGVAVSVSGGPRRLVRGVLIASLVLAAATVIGSVRPSVALIAVSSFVFMGAMGVVISTNQSIWQTKVEPHLMGRVMAVVTAVSLIPQFVANIVAGVAVDRVFEPFVGRAEVRDPALARLLGDGPGRGIALLMMVVGVLIALAVVAAALSLRLRRLEAELPDTTDEAEPGPFTSTPPPDRVGPIEIPAELADRLRTLAASAGVDDLAVLSAGIEVLAARLTRPGSTCPVRVVHGGQEVVVSAARSPGSFRDLLARGSRTPSPEAAAVTVRVSPDGHELHVENGMNAADVPFAQTWARCLPHLLSGLVIAPDAPTDSHPPFDAAERDRIRHDLNPHRTPDIRHRTMARPFEEQVERTPDAVALLDEDGESVSYRQLNDRANQLAHFLLGLGCGSGTRVGIAMERGIHQIVAIYAAVKTGATYVPLDTELPDARLGYLLEDSAPAHVLTDPAGRGRIPPGWRVHDVETDRARWDDQPTTNPVVDGTPAAPVHILYTSGTTGQPKGVTSPTAGTLANIEWMQRQYPFGPTDAAVFKTSPGFDVSIWEIFWPLYVGARLVICRPGAHRDPRHLARLMERHGVSMSFFVPTMLTPFLEHVSADRANALRWVVSGGEPMPPRLRDTFYATLPACTLVNAFGPTEAGSVTDNIAARGPAGSLVPVGRPAENFRVTVLDEDLELVPVGSAGEAYIGGEVGIAQGYWGAPARTAERFVADPYGPPGSRLYRTGDLCRYREDGALEHLGRIDRQLKIRGLRVEPGEIESVVASHPDVGGCTVVAYGQPARLLAFVASAGARPVTALDATGIRAHVEGLLPEHMWPERIVPVPAIPATVNGKVDIDELLGIWQALVDRERDVVPPSDDLEAALAEIYSRVLDTAPISMTDTFVRLGGHSLLAFKLLDECKASLDARPEVTKLLTGTVRDVAAAIRAARD